MEKLKEFKDGSGVAIEFGLCGFTIILPDGTELEFTVNSRKDVELDDISKKQFGDENFEVHGVFLGCKVSYKAEIAEGVNIIISGKVKLDVIGIAIDFIKDIPFSVGGGGGPGSNGAKSLVMNQQAQKTCGYEIFY